MAANAVSWSLRSFRPQETCFYSSGFGILLLRLGAKVKMTPKLFVIGLMLVIFADRVNAAADIDTSCVEYVKTVCFPSWQEAVSNLDDIEVRVLERLVKRDLKLGTPGVENKSEWQICLSSKKKRRLIDHIYFNQKDSNIKDHGINVSNDRYKFALAKKGKPSSSDYSIGKASRLEEGNDFFHYEMSEQYALQQILSSSYYIHGLSLQSIIDDPGFKMVSAKYLGDSDPKSQDRKIRLEWRRLGGNAYWGKLGTIYWAELSPKHSWLISRCGIKNPDGSEYNKQIEYQPFKSTFFPKSVNWSEIEPGFTSENKTFEFDPPRACGKSDDEFFLPKYGISESIIPDLYPNKSLRMGAVVLSSCGLIVAVVVYRLSRKNTTRKEPA